MAVTGRVCPACELEKELEAFPRSKYAKDGSGRALYCMECMKRDPEVRRRVIRERQNGAYRCNALFGASREQALAHQREQLERREQELATYKTCHRCGQSKCILDFPKNSQQMDPGEHGRSRFCWECVRLAPDGMEEVIRERARDRWRWTNMPMVQIKAIQAQEAYQLRKDRQDRERFAARFGLTLTQWDHLTPEGRVRVIEEHIG